jgi:hypothetical protein
MDVRSDLLPCFMFTGEIRTRQEVWFGSPGFPLGVSVSTTEPKASPPAGGESRPKGSKTLKLTVHEERTVELIAPPQGGRFKGYTDNVVQDLVIRAHIVNFRREHWQIADGEMKPLQRGSHVAATPRLWVGATAPDHGISLLFFPLH